MYSPEVLSSLLIPAGDVSDLPLVGLKILFDGLMASAFR